MQRETPERSKATENRKLTGVLKDFDSSNAKGRSGVKREEKKSKDCLRWSARETDALQSEEAEGDGIESTYRRRAAGVVH